jgi:hypothetical protein
MTYSFVGKCHDFFLLVLRSSTIQYSTKLEQDEPQVTQHNEGIIYTPSPTPYPNLSLYPPKDSDMYAIQLATTIMMSIGGDSGHLSRTNEFYGAMILVCKVY